MPRDLSSLKDLLSFDSILNWLKFKYEMWIGWEAENGIVGDWVGYDIPWNGMDKALDWGWGGREREVNRTMKASWSLFRGITKAHILKIWMIIICRGLNTHMAACYRRALVFKLINLYYYNISCLSYVNVEQGCKLVEMRRYWDSFEILFLRPPLAKIDTQKLFFFCRDTLHL